MVKVEPINFKSSTTISSISREELKNIKKRAIKKWHWEKGENGIVPISDEDKQ